MIQPILPVSPYSTPQKTEPGSPSTENRAGFPKLSNGLSPPGYTTCAVLAREDWKLAPGTNGHSAPPPPSAKACPVERDLMRSEAALISSESEPSAGTARSRHGNGCLEPPGDARETSSVGEKSSKPTRGSPSSAADELGHSVEAGDAERPTASKEHEISSGVSFLSSQAENFYQLARENADSSNKNFLAKDQLQAETVRSQTPTSFPETNVTSPLSALKTKVNGSAEVSRLPPPHPLIGTAKLVLNQTEPLPRTTGPVTPPPLPVVARDQKDSPISAFNPVLPPSRDWQPIPQPSLQGVEGSLPVVDPYMVVCPLERYHIFMHLAWMSSQALTQQAKPFPDAVVHPTPNEVAFTPNGVGQTPAGVFPTFTGVAPAIDGGAPTPNGLALKHERFDQTTHGVAPSPSGAAPVPSRSSPGTSTSLSDSGLFPSPRLSDSSATDTPGREKALIASNPSTTSRYYIPEFAPFASRAVVSFASNAEINNNKSSPVNTESKESSSTPAAVHNDEPLLVNTGCSGQPPTVADVINDSSFTENAGSSRPQAPVNDEKELSKNHTSATELIRPKPLRPRLASSASYPSLLDLHGVSPGSERPRRVCRQSSHSPSSSPYKSVQPLHRSFSPSKVDLMDPRNNSSPPTMAHFATDAQDHRRDSSRRLTFTEGDILPGPPIGISDSSKKLVRGQSSAADLENGDKETRKPAIPVTRETFPETQTDISMETNEPSTVQKGIGVKKMSSTLADGHRSHTPVVENLSPAWEPADGRSTVQATRDSSHQESASDSAAQAKRSGSLDFLESHPKTPPESEAASKFPRSTKSNLDAATLLESVSEQLAQSNTSPALSDSSSKSIHHSEPRSWACARSEVYTEDSQLSESNLEPTSSTPKALCPSEWKTKKPSGSGNHSAADSNLPESDADHPSPSSSRTMLFNSSDPNSVVAYPRRAYAQSLGSLGAGALTSCPEAPDLMSTYYPPPAQSASDLAVPQVPFSPSHHALSSTSASKVPGASSEGDRSSLTTSRPRAESPNPSCVAGTSSEGGGSSLPSRDRLARQPTPGPAGVSPVGGSSEEKSEGSGMKRRRCQEETSSSIIRTPNTSGESGFESADDTLKRSLLLAEEEEQSGKRARRSRTNYSRHEVECLEEEFSRSQYVSQYTRDALSRRLGLTPEQVKVWFQNRRMKAKKSQDGRGRGPRAGDSREEEMTLQELYMPKGGTSVQAMSRLGIHLPDFLGSNKPLTRTYVGKDKEAGKDVAPPAPLTYRLPSAPPPHAGAFASLSSGTFGIPGSLGGGAFGCSSNSVFGSYGNGAFGSSGNGASGSSGYGGFGGLGSSGFAGLGSGAYGGLGPAALGSVGAYGGLGGYGALAGFGGLGGLVSNPFLGGAFVPPRDDQGLTSADMISALPGLPPGIQHLAPVSEHQPGHQQFKMHLLKQLGISDSTIADAKQKEEEEARSKARAVRVRPHNRSGESSQHE